MKKKLLLLTVLVVAFACLFAIGINAEDIVRGFDYPPTLSEIHANPSAYVSHLSAFDGDSLGEQDSQSVVVLSDLATPPTYYVFPAYYYMRSTQNYVAGNLTKLNEAIAAYNTTTGSDVFANYQGVGTSGDWTGGKCLYLIRYEVPTYVTSITGRSKFQGDTNLLEVYFPINEETGLTYVTSISGQNLFGECTKLEYIHNSGKLPAGIVQGNKDGFSSCGQLKEFEVPYGVTSVPWGCFGGCSSLTEIILPNTVTTMDKKAFIGCSGLQTFSFGAGFYTFNNSQNNGDFEHLSGTSSLKYVYLPDNNYIFKYETGTIATTYKAIFNSGKNVTYFFTGSYANAKALQDGFIESGANSVIAGATLVEYDPTRNYEGYADTLGYSIIVYNYSACEAFYDGAHTNGTEYKFRDEDGNYKTGLDKYTAKFCKVEGCTQCIQNTVTDYGYLFTSKGYSLDEKDPSSFSYGILFNLDVIELYKEKMSVEFTYGLIVGSIPADADGKIMNVDGTTNLTNVLLTTLNPEVKYSIYNIKLVNINTENYKALDIYCGAYIIDGTSVVYAGAKVTDTAVPISYNKVAYPTQFA